MEDKQMFTKEEVEEIVKNSYSEQMLQFAQKMQSLMSNNFVVAQNKNLFSRVFSKENVQTYLENPQRYEKELRQLSFVLTTISPQYKQICNYYANISKFVPILNINVDKYTNAKGTVGDTEKIKKDYLKGIAYLNRMSIPHEFQKILSIIARDDVFYGYIYETNNSFYIQSLDADYCRISSVIDGCFNFQFDFSYFDQNNELKDVQTTLLESYAPEFQQKYNAYLKDTNLRWQELDDNNTICIKFDESSTICFPPYASLFNDLSNLSDYKELTREKMEVENYKFIGMEMPLNEKSGKSDDFLVSTTTALSFYQMMQNNLPNGISSFISATPFKAIDFSTNMASEKNKVQDAENTLFASSGITPVNFGINAQTSTALKSSNLLDSGQLYKLYNQFERWLNKKFKAVFNDKFIVSLLPVTIHTMEATFDRYKEMATLGLPIKLQLASLLDIDQLKERGFTLLENSLGLIDDWKPLATSYTQSGNGDAREKVSDDALSDSGENTRDTDGNDERY